VKQTFSNSKLHFFVKVPPQ